METGYVRIWKGKIKPFKKIYWGLARGEWLGKGTVCGGGMEWTRHAGDLGEELMSSALNHIRDSAKRLVVDKLSIVCCSV